MGLNALVTLNFNETMLKMWRKRRAKKSKHVEIVRFEGNLNWKKKKTKQQQQKKIAWRCVFNCFNFSKTFMTTILHFIKVNQRMHVHTLHFDSLGWWRLQKEMLYLLEKEEEQKSIFQVACKSVGILSIAFMNATNSIYSVMLCYAYKYCSRCSMIYKLFQFTLCQRETC